MRQCGSMRLPAATPQGFSLCFPDRHSFVVRSEKCEIRLSFTQVLEAVRLAAIVEKSKLSPAGLLGPSLRKALDVVARS